MTSEEYPSIGLLDDYLNGPVVELEEFTQLTSHAEVLEEMDIKNFHVFSPFPATSNIISNEEYPGPYDFEVCIIPVATKQPWVYSSALNKVFMDMSNPFPIDFKIKNFNLVTEQLYIRATPRYLQSQYLHDLVHRCINHEHIHEPSNKGFKDPLHRQHIIRCHNRQTFYIGDKDKNERLSVLIPLSIPEPGTESVKEMYEFVCKNSCPNPGMNRRAIEVIFTLENLSSEILGRRVLNVRICSCPKRDKEKEEEILRASNNPVPHGKKRKLNIKSEKKSMPLPEVTKDMREYELPNIKIVGKHNLQQVLKFCEDLMAGEVCRHAPHGTDAPFRKAHSEFVALRNKEM